MSLEPGQTFSHYRLLDKVGEGGMGVVWKATDTRLHRTVALKFLPEAFTRNRERLNRFQREAQILASLNHENIATIHGLEPAEDAPFLVMELVEGETLGRHLSRGPLPLQKVLDLGSQVAGALAAAHQKGIIHRDLKPDNVMLTPEGASSSWTSDWPGTFNRAPTCAPSCRPSPPAPRREPLWARSAT